VSQDKKRLQWELIKTEAQDVAVWLSDVSRVFGKPAALHVELVESGSIVESGEFDPVHITFDGKARSKYGKR